MINGSRSKTSSIRFDSKSIKTYARTFIPSVEYQLTYILSVYSPSIAFAVSGYGISNSLQKENNFLCVAVAVHLHWNVFTFGFPSIDIQKKKTFYLTKTAGFLLQFNAIVMVTGCTFCKHRFGNLFRSSNQ